MRGDVSDVVNFHQGKRPYKESDICVTGKLCEMIFVFDVLVFTCAFGHFLEDFCWEEILYNTTMSSAISKKSCVLRCFHELPNQFSGVH